jgi:peptidoglycan/LPS O-acetylase OafA/YrhL
MGYRHSRVFDAQRYRCDGHCPGCHFFVLSGFVLARALERNPEPVTFLRHRAFRLFPAAIVTVLTLTALHSMFGFFVGFKPSFDWLNVVANALLIRSDINGPMWSLTVEAFATPLILGSFWAHRKFGPAPLVAACVILFGLSFWGPYVNLLGGWTNLGPLYCFVAGVWLHFAVPRASQHRFVAASGWLAVAVLIALGTRKQTALIIFIECLASTWLIYSIAISRESKVFCSPRPVSDPVSREDFVQLLPFPYSRNGSGDALCAPERATCFRYHAGPFSPDFVAVMALDRTSVYPDRALKEPE